MKTTKFLLLGSLSLTALSATQAQAQTQASFDLWGSDLTISSPLLEYEAGFIMSIDDDGEGRGEGNDLTLTSNIAGQLGPFQVDVDFNWLEPDESQGNIYIEDIWGKINLGSDKVTTVPQANDAVDMFSSQVHGDSLFASFVGGDGPLTPYLPDDQDLTYPNISYFSPTRSGFSYGASYNTYAGGLALNYASNGFTIGVNYEFAVDERAEDHAIRYLVGFESGLFSIEAIFEEGTTWRGDADEQAVTLSYGGFSLVHYENSQGRTHSGIGMEFGDISVFAGTSDHPGRWKDGVTLRAQTMIDDIDYTLEYLAIEDDGRRDDQQDLILGVSTDALPFDFHVSIGERLCCTKEVLGKSCPFPVDFSPRAAWSAFRAG